MSISGDLQDVSVAEVMQFIHLGRRTGTLSLRTVEREASIGFHRGRIISASRPSSEKLGELLIEKEIITESQLQQALESQACERPRPSLGKVLVTAGVLTPDRLRVVVGSQIERSIYELVTWRSGKFDFSLDELKPMDDIGVYPGDVLPDINLDTQMVVLDALRIFDEKNRLTAEQEEPATEPPKPQPAAPEPPPLAAEPQDETAVLDELFEAPAKPESPEAIGTDELEAMVEDEVARLQIVTADEELARELLEGVPETLAEPATVELMDAGLALPGRPAPVVLLDLRGGATHDDLAGLARSRARATFIAVVGDPADAAVAYGAGAMAALPPDPDAIIACLTTLLGKHGHPDLAGLSPSSPGFAKLRRVVADLRSGLLSATVALNLMQVISESVERAIMFLVRENHLLALGAFGYGASGQPLANETSGLKIDLSSSNALTDSIDHGETRSLVFEEAHLPASFVELVGRPRTSQVVLFPVLGSESVIAIVYADNGQLSREIEEIEILELAAAQVGVAFENELLRREMARHGA